VRKVERGIRRIACSYCSLIPRKKDEKDDDEEDRGEEKAADGALFRQRPWKASSCEAVIGAEITGRFFGFSLRFPGAAKR
jgi:hypothetical protein